MLAVRKLQLHLAARIAETGKGCRAFSLSLFARSFPLWLLPISEAQKHLDGRKYQTRKNLGSAIYQCLNSILRKDYTCKNALNKLDQKTKTVYSTVPGDLLCAKKVHG
jgi:hypothetical protein